MHHTKKRVYCAVIIFEKYEINNKNRIPNNIITQYIPKHRIKSRNGLVTKKQGA